MISAFFIVGWIVLVIGLAIVIVGDESNFYRGSDNSKNDKKIYNLLRKFYGE